MGFLDSSSSIITAILTRKGRESLAKNDGTFRISKFAFGDDEINYQLYNATTDSDTDILNLPVLEPSSNELTALRYRLVTAPRGSIQAAYLQTDRTSLTLATPRTQSTYPTRGLIKVTTVGGTDTAYLLSTQSNQIAYPTATFINANFDNETGEEEGIVAVVAGDKTGTTFIEIVGKDSGASLWIPVTVVAGSTIIEP